MTKAVWNGAVVANSDKCEKVEGNFYFPPDAVDKKFFKDSATTSICSWKGEAHYYSLDVNGQINKDAAWYYPDPKPEAKNIKGYVAFWRGVKFED
jgi:uncharacterized protein (DUF427 family)